MKQIDIKVEIDPSLKGNEVIIRTNQRTELIDQIVEAIERCAKKSIHRSWQSAEKKQF